MPKTKIDFNLEIEEMARAGLHFGHRTFKLHPKMEPYIYGVKNTVHLFDLEKTKEKLEQAMVFIQEQIKQGKKLLLVSTQAQHREPIEAMARELGLAYVTERWLGGTLTNFSVMKKRIDYLKELEQKKNSSDFEKYTKKEQADLEKEINDLGRKFGGVRDLMNLPDLVFACSLRSDELAVKEAKMKQIPVIGVTDSNTDPEMVDYPIPANDDASSSMKYILEKVAKAIKNGQLQVTAEEIKEKPENESPETIDD